MRRLRFILGVVLVVGGPSAGILVLRAAVGDRARAQAALVAAADREVEARHAQARHAVEAQVSAAAALEPLAAGLRARVDGATLVDMFENEDWWRPYRGSLPLLRVIADGQPLATRGPAISAAEEDVVARARAQRLASALVHLDTGTFLIAAARIAGADERDPILVLGRPVVVDATAAPPPAIAASPLGERTVVWPVVGVVCLFGLGLVISTRRRPEGAVPLAAVHEITAKFGTPANPRPVVPATPPARGRITDGQAVRIPSAPGVAVAAALAPRPSSDPGTHFGRYRLLGRLGEGGMSEIFIAEAAGVEGFSRTFVLKRLRHELAHHPEAVAQFIDEARMQAGLVHSNIVPVFDFGVVGGEYFMTQEYIVGRDLVKTVQRYYEFTKRSMETRFALYIAHETLLALEYAHTKRDRDGLPMGIVHRDVSAGNIMMSLEGEVKLFDFGIVKARGRSTQTQIGMVKGNTSFMSPEQARGQDVDARSDLFSLALVVYYCLTGRLLYEGDNDLDVLYKAASGPTPKDWEAISQLPRPTPEIFARALAIDPAQRYQSAAEFAQDLAPHINGVKAEAASLIQLLFGDELRREAA